jgi:hypothetical protein
MFKNCPMMKKENSDKLPYFGDEAILRHHMNYIYTTYNLYKENDFQMTICDAVYLYTITFDNYINGVFRPGYEKLTDQNIQSFIDRIIHLLDEYFEQTTDRVTAEMVDNEKNIVYRGEKTLCTGDVCRSGEILSYTSTSTDIEVVAEKFINFRTRCCLYEYRLAEGIPYIDVKKILGTGELTCGKNLVRQISEDEWILPRGIILTPINLNPEIMPYISKSLRSDTYRKKYNILVTYDGTPPYIPKKRTQSNEHDEHKPHKRRGGRKTRRTKTRKNKSHKLIKK